MLQKEFFQVQPFNPNPYWENTVLINLSGSSKYEQNTIFVPGRYRIQIAPGLDSYSMANSSITTDWYTTYMDKTETITEPFIVRAYCGGNASSATSGGTNPYSGAFKVNSVNASNFGNSMPNGVDVNHIFGAGGGNGKFHIRLLNIDYWVYLGGGGNCLGNGNVCVYNTNGGALCATGAGSCLHLIPVNGVFGTNYIRAYQITASPAKFTTNQAEYEYYGKNACGGGSARGGGATPSMQSNNVESAFTRGGNSPYGNGATTLNSNGTGTGAGKLYYSSLAYFNGSSWSASGGTNVQTLKAGVIAPKSYIKITYLGPLS